MKKVIMTLLCLSAGALAANAQDNKQMASIPPPVQQQSATAPDPDAGKFKFKEETHDFGNVQEGPDQEYDFTFKNTGKSAILISEAHGSCGCTVPQWPKDPILPGEKGAIHVTYHTAGRAGAISKEVIITSNAQQPTTTLHIRGTVQPKSVATTAVPEK